ncbi:MAG: hypothetical protein B7Z15_02735, partial [Rhizobiales bacterium 32-66-8]
MCVSRLTLTFLLALSCTLATVPAHARPASYALSCAAASGLVARQGAVVMDTSRTTFDRYVRDVRFCMPGQALRPQWVQARDTPQCFIGYTCFDPDRGFMRWG